MISITSPGPSISNADIEQAELTLKVNLPIGYRRFLLDNNGGAPGLDGVDVPGFEETDVQVFYGIRRSIESSCIHWNVDVLSGRLPRGFVPIAGDSGGNVFCLSLGTSGNGEVVYVDLDSVFGESDALPALYPVASSFESFLRALHL